ncbi:hypothetical protein M405DRAFT_906790, partial [Rhizopogon salebrosus TDB-379]
FTGSLSTKNRDDLIDIAGAFQISALGTKRKLLNAIREHFESHPELKDDEHFSGLFTGRTRGQKRSFNEGPLDENDQNAPPATRPRLEIIPSHSTTTPLHAGPSSTPRNILATSSSQNAFGAHSNGYLLPYPTDMTRNSFNIPFNPHLNSTSGFQPAYFSAPQ